MTAQMNFPDMGEGEAGEIGVRIEIVVGRRDEDIVDVEQQAAAGPRSECAEEIRLLYGALFEEKIGAACTSSICSATSASVSSV